MKKFFFLAAAASCALSMDAQTVDLFTLPTTQAEATALGWEGAWGNIEWGAMTPANWTPVDNEYAKVTVASPAVVTYSCAQAGKGIYPNYIYFGSQAGRNGSEAVWDVSAIAREQNAVFEVDAKVNGMITLYYSRGANNSAAYAWDMTANEGAGVCVLSNITVVSDEPEKKIHTPSFSVVAGHKYYIFSSDNGVELYRMTLDPYSGNTYTPALPDNSRYLLSLPKTAAEATALGWEGAWGNIEWGAMTPENWTAVDNSDITITVKSPAVVTYSCSQAGKDIYPNYIYFGSQAGRNGSEAVWDVSAIARENNAIFHAVPKVNGKMTLYYSRGANNSAAYVWDMTANEGAGVCVLSNITEMGEEPEKKIHAPGFNLTAGHEYYIFSSDNGVELYNMTFAAYGSDDYYNSGSTSGIDNITSGTAASPSDGKIYTIDGRYAGTAKENLPKGLYIRGGKKFVVK